MVIIYWFPLRLLALIDFIGPLCVRRSEHDFLFLPEWKFGTDYSGMNQLIEIQSWSLMLIVQYNPATTTAGQVPRRQYSMWTKASSQPTGRRRDPDRIDRLHSFVGDIKMGTSRFCFVRAALWSRGGGRYSSLILIFDGSPGLLFNLQGLRAWDCNWDWIMSAVSSPLLLSPCLYCSSSDWLIFTDNEWHGFIGCPVGWLFLDTLFKGVCSQKNQHLSLYDFPITDCLSVSPFPPSPCISKRF